MLNTEQKQTKEESHESQVLPEFSSGKPPSMAKRTRSALLHYGLALVLCVVTILISVSLSYYSIKLNLTILVVLALIVPTWYGGKGPGLLVAIIFEAVTIISNPIPPPNTSIGQFIFSHFSIMSFYVFLVLLVSSRRNAENQLRGSEERYRHLFENNPLPMWVYELKTLDFLAVNHAATFYYGYSQEEFLSMNIKDIRPPEDVPALLKNVAESHSKLDYADIWKHRKKDGSIIDVEITSHKLIFDGRHSRLVLANDVTERKRAEAELAKLFEREQEARCEAEEANRIKDEFLSTVSHELRTPLNAILGWSNLLRSGRLDKEDSTQALETVERNAQSQAQLIDDLLDTSRIITGKLRLEIRPLDLSHVIKAAVEAIRPAAEAKNIRLQMLLDVKAGAISGDSNRLQQVFWNLLTNAIKFTPKDGRVQARLGCINSHVEVIISDTGQGIAPEFLPYIFDRFRQADQTITRKQGGLGLGLSIVHQLVEMHGGSIHVQSDGPGLGAIFTVKLPLAAANIKSAGSISQPSKTIKNKTLDIPEMVLSGIRVLVVDDETDARELVKVMLSRYGAEVVTVESVEEALEKLSTSLPDVLVSDIGMPGKDGYELIRQVRNYPQTRSVHAIALTAYARKDDCDRALSEGFNNYLKKPVEAAELIKVVAQVNIKT